MDAWVVEVLRVGYRIPFDRRPSLSERPLSLPAYSPQSIKGVALTQELQTLLRKRAVEPAPQSPCFYSRLFLVQKASGSWRPIIDLSTLNDYIPSRLFVSLRNPERAMSKNAMSFYLRQIIVDSGAVCSSRPSRAHDIRGIATSLNYYSNFSLSNLMQVATWNRVFASRYLKEVCATQDNIQQFGPLVIAGDRLHPRPPQHKH